MIEIRAANIDKEYPKMPAIPGVYCWGYFENNTFIPLYVGKTRNVHERLIQHYCRFKSGEYQLFDPDELRAIYITKTRTDEEFKPIYQPNSFRNMLCELPRILNKHKYQVDNFVFRYVEIPVESERIQAERSLANSIGRGRLLTKVSKGGDSQLSDELKLLVMSSTTDNIPF